MENNKAVYTREQKRRLWSAQLASITGFLTNAAMGEFNLIFIQIGTMIQYYDYFVVTTECMFTEFSTHHIICKYHYVEWFESRISKNYVRMQPSRKEPYTLRGMKIFFSTDFDCIHRFAFKMDITPYNNLLYQDAQSQGGLDKSLSKYSSWSNTLSRFTPSI